MEYRGYLIKYSKNTLTPSLLTIAVEGQGGKIPKVLEGSFTNYAIAKLHIDYYLDNKVVKNAKENSKSGD